jgi:hypothetical protein
VPAPLRRALLVCAVVLLAAGCGSSRTTIPDDLGTTVPGATEPPSPTTAIAGGAATSSVPAASTTTSPFQTAGLKHTLASGATVVVSYANNNARVPKDVPPPPAGTNYAIVTTKLCAARTGPIPGEIVDPGRYSVEVPGQGLVAYNPAVPVLRGPALPKGTTVNPGACLEGTITFVIGGERHIESIQFDAGEGLFRWVS